MFSYRGVTRAVPILLAGLITSATVAACSSSGTDKPAAPTSGGAQSSGPALTGSPVKFLAMTKLSGPAQEPADAEAVKAAVRSINDNGGLAGHPIQIDLCDSGLTANQAATCAHKAVDGGYLAVLGEISGLGAAIAPITDPAGVLNIGNWGADASSGADPLSFPTGASPIASLAGAAVIIGKGGKSPSLILPNVSAATGLAKLVDGLVKSLGASLKRTTLLPIDSGSDYSQFVQQAYGNGSSGVFGTTTAQESGPFLTAAIGQGIDFGKQTTVFNGALFRPEALSSGALSGKLDGLYIADQGFDASDTSNAGIAQFHRDLQAVGAKEPPSEVSLNYWVTAQLIKMIVDKTPTAIDSKAALKDAFNKTGPITPPGWVTLDYTKPAVTGQLGKLFPRLPTTYSVIYKVSDNKFKLASKGQVNGLQPISVTS